MDTQLALSIVSGVSISATAGYLGTLMLSKKMSVVAGPLAHLALPGAALAILFGGSLFFGVFPFVLMGAALIWVLERRTKLPMENLSAIIFAFGVGTALLILPIEKANAALVGSINTISFGETLATIIIASFTLLLTRILYPKMLLTNVHEDLARTEGFDIGLYNFLYLFAIGLVVSLGVYLVGALITAALIAIPSATAKNVSHNMTGYMIWAMVFGVAATIIGIFLNRSSGLPTGPLIIVISAGIFILSVVLKRDALSRQ